MQKDYLEGRALVKPTSSWTFKDVNSERGTEEFIRLGFDKRIFPKPKPVGTIERCIKLCSKSDNDIIVDFFSGSGTTAQALLNLNASDGISRHFIMIQFEEKCEVDSEAYKAGYKTICEIGKERIRRAAKKIAADNSGKPFDGGFRVFKLDDTNMKDTSYRIYLDQYGYLAGIEILEEPDQYVFLAGINGNNSNLSNETAKGRVIFLDGTSKVVDINMDKSADASEAKGTLKNKIDSGHQYLVQVLRGR